MEQFVTEIGGKYKIESSLGRGAFGVVYKCINKETGDIVAVKTLRRANESSQKILKAEIDVLKSIACNNVVRMIESFSDRLPYEPGEYEFLVMEYCEKNLLEYVSSQKDHRVVESEAIKIFAQILNGFQSIHEKGIMHRDLKLENVLVTANGVVKIADFGLAKRLQNQHNSADKDNTNANLASSFCGTKAYVAPEILKRESYDYKVDIWSLGVLLFVMIFFKFPFGSRQDSTEQLLKTIKSACEGNSFDTDAFIVKHSLQACITLSTELKDLFKKIFIEDPKQRIGFEELLQHPVLLPEMQGKENHIDFYEKMFPSLFKYASEIDIGERPEQGNPKGSSARRDSMTNGQLISLINARSSFTNRVRDNQFKQHILIYQHLVCRYQVITIAYEQSQEAWLLQLLGDKDTVVLKYFLLKLIAYFLINLKRILQEADNPFNLTEWPSFVSSKSYRNVCAQVEEDSKRWIPQFYMAEQDAQELQYESADIKKGVFEKIISDVEMDAYVNTIPSELKLPMRAVLLTVFTKIYEYAAMQFKNQEKYQQQIRQFESQQLAQKLRKEKLENIRKGRNSSLDTHNTRITAITMSHSQGRPKNTSNTPAAAAVVAQQGKWNNQISSPVNKQQQQQQQFFQSPVSNYPKNSSSEFQRKYGSSVVSKLDMSSPSKFSSNNMSKSTINNQHSNQSTVQISKHGNTISHGYNNINSNTTLSSVNLKYLQLKMMTAEQYGLKGIRLALMLISSGVINRIFEVPSCIIRLREFQPYEIDPQENNSISHTFRFEDLVAWFYQVSKEKAYVQIELIVNSYFKQISQQLFAKNNTEKQEQQQHQQQQQSQILNQEQMILTTRTKESTPKPSNITNLTNSTNITDSLNKTTLTTTHPSNLFNTPRNAAKLYEQVQQPKKSGRHDILIPGISQALEVTPQKNTKILSKSPRPYPK